MTPNARAREAMAVAAAFWDAVAGDDDEALVALLAPSALAAVRGADQSYAGLAAAFREHHQLTAVAIVKFGWLDSFGILAEGGFRIRRTPIEEGPVEPGQPIEAWPVDVIPGTGDRRWVVDPIRPFARAEVGTMDVDLGAGGRG